MLLPRNFRRQAVVFIVLLLLLNWYVLHKAYKKSEVVDVSTQYPLLSKYIGGGKGNGGAWYHPLSWTHGSITPQESVVAAAQLARNLSLTDPQRQIPYSSIPRIIHQTWKDTNIETWRDTFRQSAEKWLTTLENDDVAYIFWDDAGIAQFMHAFEPKLEATFYALPSNVERSDVFRMLVCKWIGGVYVDLDTEPLKPPTSWITQTDITPWTDPQTGRTYTTPSPSPVGAIVGIEADNLPDTDTYWRMGYGYPVQLTQWAFAFAPHHPVIDLFIDNLLSTMNLVTRDQDILSQTSQEALNAIDPVNLTGPIAVTEAVREYLEGKADLRWDALSGVQDGGRSKLVEDVLVLPITGFSPGRGQYGNMGSKPVTDQAARLYHHAEGSWRNWSLRVEYGKFCRTVFGRCRDWSKVAHGIL
ncbi:nucleotide-diphospho-sugar transferase [Aspergillus karnatakaensis]|uniref:glycosyltransferase family 32 protein n=1 Tax=Aspergillus karnatakaensis TaxID=1810916 RepID=UPI003CCDE914